MNKFFFVGEMWLHRISRKVLHKSETQREQPGNGNAPESGLVPQELVDMSEVHGLTVYQDIAVYLILLGGMSARLCRDNHNMSCC